MQLNPTEKTRKLGLLGRKVKSAWLESAQFTDSSDEFVARATLRQLRHLFAEDARLKPQPMEQKELALDRFLLRYSACYRRTRALALELGAAYRPMMLSTYHSLVSFEYTGTILYAPVHSELKWLTMGRAPEDYRAQTLKTVCHFAANPYHDSNHWIISSGLIPRPVRMGLKQAHGYYAMLEALSVIRDLDLGDELGEITVPLRMIGLAYRAGGYVPGRKSCLSYEDFTDSLAFITVKQLEGCPEKTERALLKLGHRLPTRWRKLNFSPEFIGSFSPGWAADTWRKTGGRMPLRSQDRIPSLRLDFKDARSFLRDQRQLMALYDWYGRVFWS